MKAVSIQQPWAWAILNAGKNVENRTWTHNYRGDILIHTGKIFDHDGFEWIAENFRVEMPRKHEFRKGGVVGMVKITRVTSLIGFNKWACGPVCWILENPRPLDFFPFRGQLGLFNIKITNKSNIK